MISSNPDLPCPSEFGWEKEHNVWVPHWISIPALGKKSRELVSCTCKGDCSKSGLARVKQFEKRRLFCLSVLSFFKQYLKTDGNFCLFSKNCTRSAKNLAKLIFFK